MIKLYPRVLVGFILICLIVGAVITVKPWIESWNLEKQQVRLNKLLKRPEIEQNIRHLWRWGDSEELWKSGKIQCKNFPLMSNEISSRFLRCNPLFLQCLYENPNNRYFSKDSLVLATYSDKNVFRFDLSKNGYWINYFLGEDREYTYEVFLKSNCFEKELPAGIYGAGVLNKNKDWKWDNLDYKIHFDSELVTNFDVLLWKEANSEKVKSLFNKELFRPSTTLTYAQMQQYCQDHGKELLNARVLDAASAYMPKKAESKDLYVPRSKYPWRGREQNQFLYVAQTDNSFEFSKEYCEKIYTKECLNKVAFKPFEISAKGSLGINFALGGYPEAVLNKRDPDYNLKASSFLFPITSRWHEIGKRVKWNGLKGKEQQVIWMDQALDYGDFPTLRGDVPVAFRCMRVGDKR